MSEPVVRAAAFADLAPDTAYRLWALRGQVFVVEQECAYADLDGRDTEPATVHLWVEDGAADRPAVPVATLRVLDDAGVARIGRVATAASHRGRGLAAALMTAALEHVGERDCVLDAQSHLSGWYERFGYVVDGPDFLDDGIPHTPMRRVAPPRP